VELVKWMCVPANPQLTPSLNTLSLQKGLVLKRLLYKSRIFYFSVYGKPRVCSFDAWYYCFECHENDDYYIPALVIHNWDFRKHPGNTTYNHLNIV
jgi:hypothetical protein